MGDISTIKVHSGFLSRTVLVDIHRNMAISAAIPAQLLFINDGQDLYKMGFNTILEEHVATPFHLICIGIHAGPDRKQEYGISGFPDYQQRGSSASAYASFLVHELIPVIRKELEKVYVDKLFLAGFSLGGLMAFDMAIDFPNLFSGVGVFSGSFWWRSKALDNGYVEAHDRIMHAKLRAINFHENRRFFLQAGAMDETEDRNKNGIIDSIDDTLDIIRELETIGYHKKQHIKYLELPDGRHDIETWGKAMPDFLNWLAGLE